jgi:hypothetical protein
MGCLTLNASFEPLTILPVERALRLVIDEKAEVLEVDAARVFRSQWEERPCPVARDSYRCQYCTRHRSELRDREFLTRDHVIPLACGGDNTWENVVTACSTCNNRKASHLPEHCGMFPLRPPVEPNHVELVWAVRRITDVQAKYISMFYGSDVLARLKKVQSSEVCKEVHIFDAA